MVWSQLIGGKRVQSFVRHTRASGYPVSVRRDVVQNHLKRAAQEAYFESLLGQKMKGKLTGRIKWLRLWWRQDKECPNCHEMITEETG